MKDLPAAMRPREKLLSHGPAALADAELLALLLRTGMKGQGVLQLAESMLKQLGGLGGLLGAPAHQLKGIKGLGPAKRAELLAVMEVARRGLSATLRAEPVFHSPQSVKDYLQMRLGALPHEVFAVLFLDAQQRLIACEELFRGTLTQTSVYPRVGPL
jgi:DNA repair protein RadC